MRLESLTAQVINDAVKGQVSGNINVEIRQIAVHKNAQMEYQGQLVTGVTTIVPEFYVMHDENNDGNLVRLPIIQGVPTVLNYPTSVIAGWMATETGGVTLPTEWGDRENLALLYVLRRILAIETQAPLFGINLTSRWDVKSS